MRKTGNVIWIAPQEEIAIRDEHQSKSRLAQSVSEPIEMRTFQPNYAKAEDVMKLLTGEQTKATPTGATGLPGLPGAPAAPAPSGATGEKGNYLSPSGVATVDVRTNQLFVTDFPAYLERVRKLIALIDKPVKQVLIEARVVSAEDNFGRSLGVRLSYNDLSSTIPGAGVGTRVPGTTSTFGTVSGSLEGIFSLTGQSTGGGTATGVAPSLSQSTFVNLPATGQGGAAPSSIAVSLFKSGLASFINLELQAAETDGRVKSIASPRVVTADGKLASTPGRRVHTPSNHQWTYHCFPTGVLKLAVTPQITSDGTVILDLDVSQDTVGNIYVAGVSINKKYIKTRVSVENGGTVVLGGIFEQAEQETTNKVPLLGDIPVVGNLFKTNTRSQSRKELLVFITPKIINELLQAGIR